MKKIIVSAVSLFLVLISSTGGVLAETELLFGQNHFYTVLFRGNGEAIIYAKLAITNPDETPLTEFSFEVPKASPTEIVMYQMKFPQECIKYGYNDSVRPCLEYREPDYARQYYYYGYNNGQAEYQKIQYTKSGNLYRFTLPTPVEPYKSTAIIVAYAAKGYVSESAGLYTFNFETLKVPSRIQEIRVVVDVDSDLLLKGRRSSVNYTSLGIASERASAPQAISSRDLDKVVGNIGAYGPLMKEAKNLAPNESFIVKGEYAANWFRLYLSSIALTLLLVVSILAGVYFLVRFLKKRSGGQNVPGSGLDQQAQQKMLQGLSSILNLTNASVSLLSVVAVIGLTYLLNFLGESGLLRFVNFDPVFSVVGVIAIILLYVLIIFGPAVGAAMKHGWKSFISILIAEFLWFLIFLAVYLMLFQSGFDAPTIYPGPMMMETIK